MWLATTKGFFSIVFNTRAESEAEAIIVRARKLDDLRNVFDESRVIRTPDADYIGRVFCSRAELMQLMMQLAEELHYHNFKDTIAGITDQKDKKAYYTRLWTVMNDYQGQFDKGRYNP
jgi:hypothetical protein